MISEIRRMWKSPMLPAGMTAEEGPAAVSAEETHGTAANGFLQKWQEPAEARHPAGRSEKGSRYWAAAGTPEPAEADGTVAEAAERAPEGAAEDRVT